MSEQSVLNRLDLGHEEKWIKVISKKKERFNSFLSLVFVSHFLNSFYCRCLFLLQ